MPRYHVTPLITVVDGDDAELMADILAQIDAGQPVVLSANGWAIAYDVLGALGLSEAETATRLHFAKTGNLQS